jgi:transketolase
VKVEKPPLALRESAPSSGADEAAQHRRRLAAAVTTEEGPVAAAQNQTDCFFHTMSSEFQFFNKGENVSLREGFGRAMVTLGHQRKDFFHFDADVRGGTGAKAFSDAFPDRIVQFGIAEQNVMAAAAGFADTGLIPVVVGFSAFTIMRAHEMLRTAVCYGKRNVKICCSHIGLDTGPDGATAQMIEDLGTCRTIPGLTIMVPSCANEIQPMFEAVLNEPGPVYMRIGRSPTPVLYGNPGPIQVGKADLLRDGTDVTIVACGSRVYTSLDAAAKLQEQGISAAVVNIRSIKPLDLEMLNHLSYRTGAIVTVEDHSIHGGLGGAVAEAVVQHRPVPIEILGIRDKFGRSGEHLELFAGYGIAEADIIAAARRVAQRKA